MHKCQGQTLEGVVIDWDRIQTEGLFYSILARWRDSRRIHIKNLIVNEHIKTNYYIVDLFKRKEVEFNENFWRLEEKYGVIEDLKSLLTLIRETKISLFVLESFLRKHVFGDERVEDSLPDNFVEMGNKMFIFIQERVIERERWMMRKYEEYINEDNYDPSLDLDWRWEIGYDADDLRRTLLDNQYGAEIIEEDDFIEIDENTKFIIKEIEEELKEELKEENKDDQNDQSLNEDMEVDTKIHNFNEDERIPWSFYSPEINGFDSLLLLFYYKVYEELSDHQMGYFKCFNPRKLINKNRYKSLIEALNEISDINPLNEYPTKEKWRRLQCVLIPWICKLKSTDRIENQFECFEYDNNLFVIKYRKILTCHGRCKENQSNWVIEDRR